MGRRVPTIDVRTPIIYRHSGVLITFEITLNMIHNDIPHTYNLGIRTEQEDLSSALVHWLRFPETRGRTDLRDYRYRRSLF